MTETSFDYNEMVAGIDRNSQRFMTMRGIEKMEKKSKLRFSGEGETMRHVIWHNNHSYQPHYADEPNEAEDARAKSQELFDGLLLCNQYFILSECPFMVDDLVIPPKLELMLV